MYIFVLFTNLNLGNFGKNMSDVREVNKFRDCFFQAQDSSSVDNMSTFNVDYLHQFDVLYR